MCSQPTLPGQAATNSNLTKKCVCMKEVTLIEEMVYSVQRVPRVVLAAILKTIADFCSFAVSSNQVEKSVP